MQMTWQRMSNKNVNINVKKIQGAMNREHVKTLQLAQTRLG